MKILITGVAGFIGNALAIRLLDQGHEIVGIDNLNDYYEVSLKQARLQRIANRPGFRFTEMDIADRTRMAALFEAHPFDAVVNLAAQAGVRHSLENPHAYVDANLVGFANVLEGCRQTQVGHLLFASSSSVYGANAHLPFSERDNVDHPVSLYAATKKANELMAHSYAHLYGLACTGLRFFTVYGPWGRPDMAYFSFTRKILANEPIPVFNQGRMQRDFTYIDDIVEAVSRILETPPQPNSQWDAYHPDPATSYAPYRIYNIGNHEAVQLLDFIATLEKHLGKKARIERLPMQNGDVRATYADIHALQQAIGFRPSTSVDEGLERFVHWFKDYYRID